MAVFAYVVIANVDRLIAHGLIRRLAHLSELRFGQDAFEDAELHRLSESRKGLVQPRAALIIRYVIYDDYEHGFAAFENYRTLEC